MLAATFQETNGNETSKSDYKIQLKFLKFNFKRALLTTQANQLS